MEAAAQLVFPGALLVLASGAAESAIWVAGLSLVVAAARGLLSGHAMERAVVRTWALVVDAVRRTPVTRLRGSGGERVEVAPLAEAARDHASYQALGVPQLWGRLVALVALAVLTAVLLEPSWVLVGLLGAAAMFAGGRVIQARMREAQGRAWGAFVELTEDARVLVEGCLELRAHGRESRFDARLMMRVATMASGERTGASWSTVSALVPVSLALLTLLAPVRAGASWATAIFGGDLLRLGILGGTAVVTVVGVVRALELRVRTGASVRTLWRWLERAGPATPRVQSNAAVALAAADIDFEGVSFVHEGTTIATPDDFTHRWPAAAPGLAITGDNGTGKSTLALLLLGLLAPTSGRITVDGQPLSDVLSALARDVAYLPQDPLLVPDESVRWHLDYLLDEPTSEGRARAALERVGLMSVLEQRAEGREGGPLDIAAGALSGGERQRMHLARALLQDAQLYVLDEPEAGLDSEGRRMLRALCAELSTSRRVLVVAHDEAVIPDAFTRVCCSREMGALDGESGQVCASEAEHEPGASG
ncbi:MAG: ABC transporter ATP-binding protein/permease [Polyangiaceae bacterium]